MSKNQFSQILKEKTRNRALKYLTDKQGTKGRDMEYNRMEMAEYLLPTNNELSIESKKRLFAARNNMINIPSNFSQQKENVFVRNKKV